MHMHMYLFCSCMCFFTVVQLHATWALDMDWAIYVAMGSRIASVSQAMKDALNYNSSLEQLSSAEGMPQGLRKTNVYGGKYEGNKDMRELFR